MELGRIMRDPAVAFDTSIAPSPAGSLITSALDELDDLGDLDDLDDLDDLEERRPCCTAVMNG